LKTHKNSNHKFHEECSSKPTQNVETPKYLNNSVPVFSLLFAQKCPSPTIKNSRSFLSFHKRNNANVITSGGANSREENKLDDDKRKEV
jgi:hypothetical protein